MKTKWKQVHDGEWVDYAKFTKLGCCDCGLVHKVQIKVPKDGRIIKMRVWRDNRATAAKRRWNRIHGKGLRFTN